MSLSGQVLRRYFHIGTNKYPIAILNNNNKSNELLIDIGGTGDPHSTQIRRRRQVRDPNIPDFSKQECLKWANWKMLRDVKRRINHAAYYQEWVNLKNLGTMSMPAIVRDLAREERVTLPRACTVKGITNRCAITSRARGKWIKFRLSRIVWRDLADHAMISGAIRAKWG